MLARILSKRGAVVFAALFVLAAPARAFTPTDKYKELKLAGFTVLVHPTCYEQPNETAKKALDLLKLKLEEVNRLVPKKQLAALHKVRLWIEWDNRTKAMPNGTACYHPGVGWLKDNGYNPDKVKGVEIPMKDDLHRDFLFRDQPMVILHELAHAYHDQVLGYDDADVKAAFQQAKERKLYAALEKVYCGKYEKAQKGYAISNDNEYFAELSEAYFGVNDFFPFTWQDLERHDPEGWKLMVKVWGPLKREEKEVELTVQNRTGKVATLFWIQADGELKEYGEIEPGKNFTQPTYSGHRWQVRLKDAEDRYFFVMPDKNATWTLK